MGDISLSHKQTLILRPSSEKFRGYRFIPTNFLKWTQYSTPKTSIIFLAPIVTVLSLILLYAIIAFLAPSVEYHEGALYRISDPLFHEFRCWSDYHDNDYQETLSNYRLGKLAPLYTLPLIGIVILLPLLIRSIKRIPKRVQDPTPINEIADYVQKHYHTNIYSFYLKDGKMGLLNSMTLTPQLDAEYDKLKWRQRNQYLEAEKDGVFCVIDINGNILK